MFKNRDTSVIFSLHLALHVYLWQTCAYLYQVKAKASLFLHYMVRQRQNGTAGFLTSKIMSVSVGRESLCLGESWISSTCLTLMDAIMLA